METKHKPYGPYEKYFKRPLDLCCGLAAVIVFWWLYLILAVLVRIKLGSPVLFTQERPGKDGKSFNMYKFRSMTNETDENGVLLHASKRITPFGRFIRRFSLDELAGCIAAQDLDEILDARALGRAIDRFLDTQSKESRVIFLRRYWFGDSIREIAHALGMTEGTVSTRLSRTRAALRQYLLKEGFPV